MKAIPVLPNVLPEHVVGNEALHKYLESSGVEVANFQGLLMVGEIDSESKDVAVLLILTDICR